VTVVSTSVSTSRPSRRPPDHFAGIPEVDENDAKSYELAFADARRALDAQERAVNELRSRAGGLIAAAAITTSFFGSRAVSGDGLSGWVWVAVIACIVVGGCVLAVLWPRSDWSFNARRSSGRAVISRETRAAPPSRLASSSGSSATSTTPTAAPGADEAAGGPRSPEVPDLQPRCQMWSTPWSTRPGGGPDLAPDREIRRSEQRIMSPRL
jgi:hypothetical protein